MSLPNLDGLPASLAGRSDRRHTAWLSQCDEDYDFDLANWVDDPHWIAHLTNLIAFSKGWAVPDWEANFVLKVAYAIGEIDEALDGAAGVGKDPVEEELADIAIRVLAVLDAIWGDSWSARLSSLERGSHMKPPYEPMEVMIRPVFGRLCKAMEAFRNDNRRDAGQHLEFSILELFRLSERIGCNLWYEIQKKCEKNIQRPMLHGKVRNEG
jgi:hypothetical protein